MSDGAFPDRLTQLRNRWEADPSSRIFLQLAEEYRHQGRVKEALGVLDRGLREHPGYLSALVAKGRCHLELGEPEQARTVLERVVKQEATQMVANKLLVRAYLDTSEPERARERLDLYSLLNDSDPEIEELRRRLRAMEQPPQAGKPSSFPRSDGPFQEAAPAPQPRREAAPPPPEGDAFDLGLSAARRGGDVFELDLPAPRTAVPVLGDEPFADLFAPPAAPAASAVAAPEPEEEPEPEDVLFPGLASRESRRRYLDSLAAEGLFLLDLTPSEPAASLIMEPILAGRSILAPEPPPLEPAATFHRDVPVDLREPLRYPDVGASPSPAVEELPIEEPTVEAPWEPEPVAAVFEMTWEAVEEIPPLPAEPVWVEPAPLVSEAPAPVTPQAPAPAAAEPVATATLGELYLRQGHLAEAERIFREVLQREPESAAAREGLARLAARREERRPLAARELLAGYEPGSEGGAAEARSRKVFLLNSYLKRLRRGNQRDVS